MSIWFLLWFLLSFILLGATFWSTIILIQQKKAWSEFATKKGLTFVRGTFFGPCSIEGIIDGYNISLFSATQQNEDSRKNRELTVVQVNIEEPFVDSIACGAGNVITFLQSLDMLSPHDVKTGNWNKKYFIRSQNKRAVDAYLTEERVKVITNILSMPNADVIILLGQSEAVFRFETANPLKEPKQLDLIISKLLAHIQKLKPSKKEALELSKIVSESVLKSIEAEEAQASMPEAENSKEVAEKEPDNKPETEL